MIYAGSERRDRNKRAAITAALISMLSPSVVLSVNDARQVLGVPLDASQRILSRLEKDGILQQLQRGLYAAGPLISGMPRL